jgi:hypothetical protein
MTEIVNKEKKLTYGEMLQEAIAILDERGGSTRQEIWKCI